MAPSRRQRKRIPKLQDIALMWRTLLAVLPMETFIEHGWRESLKGVPNYRIKSQTRDRVWSVDVYCGGYYCVMVGERLPEIFKSPPSVVYYLKRMLSI